MSVAIEVPRRRRRTRRARRLAGRLALYAGVLVVIAVVVFPIYWMALSSIQPDRYSLLYPPPFLPHGLNWGTFADLFHKQHVARWLWNSTRLAAMTTFIALVLSVLGAYAMSRLRWRGKAIFGFLLLLTQMMPGAIIIAPVLRIFRQLGLVESLPALAMLDAAFVLPICIWILKKLVDALPRDVLDAAHVDGCGHFGVLWRIVLPLAKPGLVAVAVVAFFFSWNEYLFASTMIQHENIIPASVGIATLITELDTPVQQLLAASLIFSALPVIFYIIVQRYIVAGLTAGAVKG